MSVQTVGRKLVEMCNQGKNFEVMRTMYAPKFVSVEGDGTQTAGQQSVIRKSEDWGAVNDFHGEKAVGPYFNGPNQFAVHFTLDVTRKATGKRDSLQEVAVYTVNGDDKITREEFFNDWAH